MKSETAQVTTAQQFKLLSAAELSSLLRIMHWSIPFVLPALVTALMNLFCSLNSSLFHLAFGFRLHFPDVSCFETALSQFLVENKL